MEIKGSIDWKKDRSELTRWFAPVGRTVPAKEGMGNIRNWKGKCV